jgi:hypothetical protein
MDLDLVQEFEKAEEYQNYYVEEEEDEDDLVNRRSSHIQSQ